MHYFHLTLAISNPVVNIAYVVSHRETHDHYVDGRDAEEEEGFLVVITLR